MGEFLEGGGGGVRENIELRKDPGFMTVKKEKKKAR